MTIIGLARRPSRWLLPVLLLTTGSAYAAEDADTDAVANGANDPTVIISASRRPEELLNVDGGATVVGGETIVQRNIVRIAELEKVLPGFVVRTRGNRAYANFTIRGVFSPDFYNPAVQIYVDGVPQEAAFMAQELLDVERVEYLRGPQGTLYGRNAFAGVVSIFTNRPQETTFRGAVEAATRTWRGSLAGTIEVNPGLFLDLAGGIDRYEGRIDDVDTGEENVDDSTAYKGRVALRYEPVGSALDVTLAASGENLESREEFYLRDAELTTFRYFSTTQGPYPLLERDAYTGSLNWNYDLGMSVLSGTTSYQYVDMVRNISGFSFPEKIKSFNQELQIAGEMNQISYVVGASYLDQEFTRDAQGFPGFYGDSMNIVSSRSFGIFGEASYGFMNGFSATLGGRYSFDHAEIDYERADPNGYDFTNEEDFTKFQPKFSIGYDVNAATHLYVLVSRGYKAGGFNHSVSSPADALPYSPENAWNYEFGGRTSLLDGTLDFGAAFYHITSKDKQIYVGPLGQQVIRNVGDATSTGLELEIRYHPMDRLQLVGNFAAGYSRFETVVDPTTGASYSGRHVPYAPDVTANLDVRYLLFRDVMGGDITVQAALNHSGRVYFDEANKIDQEPVTTVDTSAEFATMDGLTVMLYGKNMFDEIYRESSFDFSRTATPDYRSIINQGRILGISVRKEL